MGEVVGGILAVARIDGFLENLQEFYQAVDEEEQALREFVQHWWKAHEERETTATALLGLIEMDDIGVDLGMGDQRSRATRLGRLLVQQRERIIGGLRVVRAGKSAGLTRWRLAPIREAAKSESSGQ